MRVAGLAIVDKGYRCNENLLMAAITLWFYNGEPNVMFHRLILFMGISLGLYSNSHRNLFHYIQQNQ